MADLTPITREEKIIAGEDVKPVTREEKILAGMDIVPVTRREKFLKAFGGGGSGAIEPLTVTENGTYTPPEGVDGYSPVSVMVAPPASNIDALIDGSITEITNNAEEIRGYAFQGCYSLKRAIFPKAKTIYMNAFANCSNLEHIELPQFSQGNSRVFDSCKKLTVVDLPSLKYTSSSMFISCEGLIEIRLPLPTSLQENCLRGCKNLKTVYLPNATHLYQQAFAFCQTLETLDLPSVTSLASSQVFYHCNSLKSVILRSNVVATLKYTNSFEGCYHFLGTVNATYNPEGLKDGYIYVPSALIEDYKAATNWSTYADRFRALEDYTVDGTITGELDETKI